MPQINYILDQLREARFVSSLDSKDGYMKIPLEETSRKLRAFTRVQTLIRPLIYRN